MQSKIGCYIIAVAVITVWSTTFVSTKILLRSLSPEEIMFYRHVLAYLVLLAAYPHRHLVRIVSIPSEMHCSIAS